MYLQFCNLSLNFIEYQFQIVQDHILDRTLISVRSIRHVLV